MKWGRMNEMRTWYIECLYIFVFVDISRPCSSHAHTTLAIWAIFSRTRSNLHRIPTHNAVLLGRLLIKCPYFWERETHDIFEIRSLPSFEPIGNMQISNDSFVVSFQLIFNRLCGWLDSPPPSNTIANEAFIYLYTFLCLRLFGRSYHLLCSRYIYWPCSSFFPYRHIDFCVWS